MPPRVCTLANSEIQPASLKTAVVTHGKLLESTATQSSRKEEQIARPKCHNDRRLTYPMASRPRHWYDEYLPAQDIKSIPTSSDQIILGQLCSKCDKLIKWFRNHVDTLVQHPRKWFKHYQNLLALKRSSEAKCHLCTIIWHDLVDRNLSLGEDHRKNLRVENAMKDAKKTHLSLGFINMGAEYELTGFIKSRSIHWHVACHIPILTTEPHFKITLEVNTMSKPGGARQDMSRSLMSTCTASNLSLQLASSWVDDCVKNHENCRRATSVGILPARLLRLAEGQSNIEGPSTVWLVSTANIPATETVEYAALSYCWGGKSSLMLTTTTQASLDRGVNVALLPETIKHAVQVTRFLGLRWLWIDSLCIMQDSPVDWSEEGARMCDIYQGSHICVAALDGRSSGDGLFARRDPLVYASFLAGDTVQGKGMCVLPSRSRGSVWCKEWPLHRRGWVVQERILSPRTLGFGRYLTWECREATRDETVPGYIRDHHEPNCGSFFRSVLDKSRCGDKMELTEAERENIYKSWLDIANNFSSCSLTVKSDRLAAISGIAAAIERRTGWKYLFGTWEPFLFKGLLWYTHNDLKSSPTGIGPTWSWISVTGHVEIPFSAGKELAQVRSLGESGALTLQETGNSINSEVPVPLLITCVALRTVEAHPFIQFLRPPYQDPLTPIWHPIFHPDTNTKSLRPSLFLLMTWNDATLIGLCIVPSQRHLGAYERVGYAKVFLGNESQNLASWSWARNLLEKGDREDFILT